MQPLTAPPRDGLTAAQVTSLLQTVPSLAVDRGLEVLDLDLNVVADISGDFQGGSVSRDCTALIHGSCALTVSTDIDYGQQLLRPYLTLTGGGVSARFNCGVYQASKPQSTLGDSLPSYQVQGADRLAQLYRPIGDAYTVDASGSYLTAFSDVFTSAGIPLSHVRIDGSAASALVPAPVIWPVLTDPNATAPLPADAVADDTGATTWLRVINSLAAQINYRGVWVDWDGFFHLDPFIPLAARSPEWVFDYDDPLLSVVGRQRTVTRDISSVPNRWVFIQSNLVDGSGNPILATEGAGQYTVRNDDDGDTSINARGGDPIGVRTSVVTLQAADQATLEALGDKQVAADQAVSRTFALTTSPFPAAWHEDVYTYSDAALGESMKLSSSGWTLDLGSSSGPVADMQHTCQQVA